MSPEPISETPTDELDQRRPSLAPFLSMLIVLAGVIAVAALLIVYGLIGAS